MKVLILGASGFLGGTLYKKLKEETDFWVLGTSYKSQRNNEFIKLNAVDPIEVKTFLEHFKADVIVWCLMGKEDEKELIDKGLANILSNIDKTCKFIFMSTNSVFSEGKGEFVEEDIPSYKSCASDLALYSNGKIDGEKAVKVHENYIIIRPGAIYGQDINGKWDKRVSQLIEDLTAEKPVVKSTNLINTFVEVNELSEAIIKLIKTNYKGIIHLGPERKENYYDYFRKIAKKLNLDENLILSDYLGEEQARAAGIILDTSINTRKGREELGLNFSSLE